MFNNDNHMEYKWGGRFVMNDHHYAGGIHVQSENWEPINVSIISRQPTGVEDSDNLLQLETISHPTPPRGKQHYEIVFLTGIISLL